MSLNHEIKALLKQKGCNIVGFADLRSISKEARQNFNCGIVIALPYTKAAMQEHKNGTPQRYYAELKDINNRLQDLAIQTARFLTKKGYKALAKGISTVVSDEDFRSALPHKTVATLAGMGWIGKNAALITGEAGSALRIIVVLTNAPLECGTPVTKSMCPPNCTVCISICPGQAPKEGLWESSVDRDTFYDAHACFAAARIFAKEKLNIEETVCGCCISHCPFTMKGLGYK